MTAPKATETKEKLSIVVPVYNEEASVRQIIERLFTVDFSPLGVEREVIAVDDGSTDGSLEVLRALRLEYGTDLRVFSSRSNHGKGAAIRIGFAVSTGSILTIQDADLEYEPAEFLDLLAPILAGDTDVVYGSRYLGRRNAVSAANRLGNGFLSLTTSLLFGSWLTDMETCYKVFRREVVESTVLSSTGFEIEPELTVKFLRVLRKKKARIVELPITYQPRDKQGGKKIHYVKDGLKALIVLLKLRLSRGTSPGPKPIEMLVAQLDEDGKQPGEPIRVTPAAFVAPEPAAAL